MERQERLSEGKALLEQARAHSSNGNAKSAIQASEAAVAIFNGLGDDNGEASAWAGVMSARFDSGDYKGGISASFAAMALYGETEDEIGEAIVLVKLAQVQLTRHLPGEALAAALSALSHTQKKGVSRLASTALEIAVKSYIVLGQAREAVSIAKQGVASARLVGNKDIESRNLQSLARAHSADKCPDIAVDTANDAILLAEQLADKALQASLLEDIARIHLAAGQVHSAKDAGDRASAFLKEFSDDERVKSVQSLMSSIEDALEREPERKTESDKQYQTARETDLLTLQNVTDAIQARDSEGFQAKYAKLDECSALTPEDWSKAFSKFSDDEQTQKWIESTLGKHPGSRQQLCNNDMFYTAFRYGGMHYGPGFRLCSMSSTHIDKSHFDSTNRNFAVLQLWNVWDYRTNPPDDYEGMCWWHPGIMDCALQAGAVRSGLYIDKLSRWNEPQDLVPAASQERNST